MKLIAFAPVDKTAEDVYQVSALEDGYRIENGMRSLDIGPHLFKPCELQFLVTSQRELGIIEQSLYVDSRDWASVMRHKDFFRMFGAVYFGPTPEESVLIISSSMFASDGVEVIKQEYAPYGAAASTVCPSAVAVRKRNGAKLELISKINPLDSLAAMEKQVDLLTLLVLTLAAKQPKDEQPEWLDALNTVFSETGSIDEGNIEASIKSMGDYKAHIRQLQEQYFKNRK